MPHSIPSLAHPLRFPAVAVAVGCMVLWSVAPLSGQSTEAPNRERSLAVEVMTFNIRTSNGRDGGNVWPNRRELVAETIRRSDPDVVGIQEALADQIAYLEEALPHYRWVGVDRGLNGGRGLSEATPIFYRHDELVPIESGTFWLSDTPELPRRRRRVSRIVTWARLHHIETRRQIYVFNTHFTLRQGPRQLQSAALINERIAALPTEAAVIVLGDFNAVAERSETWRAATAEGLRDAWVVAEQRSGPPLTSNGFGPPPEGREGRIDWILVGDGVTVTRAETIVHEVDRRFPSDHYPVVARLQLIPPSS